MEKRACVLCTGCPESRIDSSRIKNFLLENGWKITNNIENSELILFRACALTNNQVDASKSLIQELKDRKKSDAKLIVWGCLPKINRKALESVYTGISFGENEVEILDKILEAKISVKDIKAHNCMPLFKPNILRFQAFQTGIRSLIFKNRFVAGNDSIFKIKISTGCLDNCSFCSVKKSRGRVRSKSIPEIVNEFRSGLAKFFC